MKLKLLFFLVALNFALIKEVSSNNNAPLMLVGFQTYPDINNLEITFQIFFKKYNNNFTSALVEIEFNLFNKTSLSDNITKTNCTISNDEGDYDEINSKCNFITENASEIQVKLNNTNFIFYNKDENETYNPEIIESSLAAETKNDISSRINPLIFSTFYFANFSQVNNDKIVINGTMNSDITANIDDNRYTLNLSDNLSTKKYNCIVDNRSIIFNLSNSNINDNLIGKMLFNSSDEPTILIFSNSTSKNDLLLYSKVQTAYVELLGFGNYDEPKTDKNATNLVYFRGTANNLKRYVRFNAEITNSSSLRALEEPIIVNATGTLIFIDLDNGLAIYNVTYEGTQGMKIVSIESLHNYIFSNDINKFPSTAVIVIIIGENINLKNNQTLVTEFLNYKSEKPTISGNTFSFDINFPNTIQSLNISAKKKMYLNYYNLENSERDEIDCSIENKTSYFTILCEPKKDVYTQFKTLIMKIPNVTSSRRLRFLQTAVNSTYLAPTNASGDIQFEYNPEVNTFGRKSSKKKGLSGGAIAAIVLATIAAVVAVGIAMFFLNRGPVNPIKTSTEMNLPNSTTNINN